MNNLKGHILRQSLLGEEITPGKTHYSVLKK
jgi:hypothetical protein